MTAEDEVLREVREQLGLHDARSRVWRAYPEHLRPDYVLVEGTTHYLIEAKGSRAGVAEVAQLSFWRDFFARHGQFKPEEARLVLASRSVTPAAESLLETMGIDFVRLPPGSRPPPSSKNRDTVGQITTPKAWHVTYELLAGGATSVRQLAQRTNVSYGWAHKTVASLIALGVARHEHGVVAIHDVPRLLNGVAWERPFRQLQVVELPTDFESVEDGAVELTSQLKHSGEDFAFTAHTAAGPYTGYGFRADRFHLYADASVVKELIVPGNGPKLHTYKVDRPLEGATEMDGLRLASKEQVLLDLAGLGPGAKDITNALVKAVARS